jgi:WD40 domain-containing protein
VAIVLMVMFGKAAVPPRLVVDEGHADTVSRVAFAPSGSLLATCDQDGVVKAWDLATRTELRSWRVDGSPCQAIAIAPNGTSIAAGFVGRVVIGAATRADRAATGRDGVPAAQPTIADPTKMAITYREALMAFLISQGLLLPRTPS